MPRRIVGPFPELQGLEKLGGSAQDQLERMDHVRETLEAHGCHCVGHGSVEFDPQWGADLSELITRCAPHAINGTDLLGKPISSTVAIKLESLRVEIDGAGEVCAWIYEES